MKTREEIKEFVRSTFENKTVYMTIVTKDSIYSNVFGLINKLVGLNSQGICNKSIRENNFFRLMQSNLRINIENEINSSIENKLSK